MRCLIALNLLAILAGIYAGLALGQALLRVLEEAEELERLEAENRAAVQEARMVMGLEAV